MPMPMTPEPDVIGELLANGGGKKDNASDANEKKDTRRSKTNGPKTKAKGDKKDNDNPKMTKKKGDSSMKKPAAVKK